MRTEHALDLLKRRARALHPFVFLLLGALVGLVACALLLILTGCGGSEAEDAASDRFEGHDYAYFPEQLPWGEAEARCVSLGGHLASAGSAAENAFLRSLAGARNDHSWIGLSREESCDWRWSDGTPFDFECWGSGMPDSACGVQDCVELWGGAAFRWDDYQCGRPRAFLCEWDE